MNEVVLVGGSSRSPAVRAAIRRALAKEGYLEYAIPSSTPISPSAPHSQLGTSTEQKECNDLSLASFSDVLTGKTPRNNDGTQEMVRSTHRTRGAQATGNKVASRKYRCTILWNKLHFHVVLRSLLFLQLIEF